MSETRTVSVEMPVVSAEANERNFTIHFGTCIDHGGWATVPRPKMLCGVKARFEFPERVSVSIVLGDRPPRQYDRTATVAKIKMDSGVVPKISSFTVTDAEGADRMKISVLRDHDIPAELIQPGSRAWVTIDEA